MKNANEKTSALITEQEKEYSSLLQDAADDILSRGNVRFVLLAGASAAGKTTTAKMLADILSLHGKRVCTVSLDDFYKGRGEYPVLPSGKPDYESVNALDLALFAKCFHELLGCGETELPTFDFLIKARSKSTRKIKNSDYDLFVIEGLHALSDEISSSFVGQNIYGIFLTVVTPYRDIDGETLRLIRRTVRDYSRRSNTAQITLELWQRVTAGEKKYLLNSRENADRVINTFHSYETGVFAGCAPQILSEIEEESEFFSQAQRLTESLAEFEKIPSELVPKDSLLREFI